MRLKYGDIGDDASIKIQRAFRSFMKLKKKYEARQAEELETLLKNYLKHILKRTRY